MNTGHLSIRTSSFLTGNLFLAYIASCTSSRVVLDPKDLSYLYNPTKNVFSPQYNILNISDERSDLSVKFFADQMFFSEANPQGIPLSEMLITAKLYNISAGRMLADTAFYNITIPKDENREEYVYGVPLRVNPGLEYMAEVKIVDRLRNKVVQAFIPFNTLSYNNRYNFKVLGHFNRDPLFNPVVKENELLNLIYIKSPPDSIYISRYKQFTAIPDPPSMILPEKTIDYGPDTIIPLPYSDTLTMNFSQKGIYQITLDRDINEGFTILNLGDTYPELTSPETMIEPLAYLAGPAELDSMLNTLRPKVALDNFWINCGGNIERARELIRIYYTRVLYANEYFTSYKEGWRTERGMMYIIYGPPDKVYKSNDEESWGYRKPLIRSRWGTRFTVQDDYLFFKFRKKESAFSDNDFYLSRSESLITLWAQAVASWRRGIVFRLDNPEEI